ncbi:iron-containing alcohol dehydrogenase, partial [Kordiimonas pumila]
RLAAYLDLGQNGFNEVLDWVLAFRESLGIPHDAKSLGIKDADIPDLALAATLDPSMAGNPKPLNIDTVQKLYSSAILGNL